MKTAVQCCLVLLAFVPSNLGMSAEDILGNVVDFSAVPAAPPIPTEPTRPPVTSQARGGPRVRIPNRPALRAMNKNGIPLSERPARTSAPLKNVTAILRSNNPRFSRGNRKHRYVLTATTPEKPMLRLRNLNKMATKMSRGYNPSTAQTPSAFITTAQSSEAQCPFTQPITCDPQSPFRTADGSCNNLDNPSYGMAKTPMARLVNPRYDDGIEEERRMYFQTPGFMSSARTISTTVHPTTSNISALNAHILMTFSQFIDHDFALSPEIEAEGEEGEDNIPACCAEAILPIGSPQAAIDALQDALNEREECFPILISDEETIFQSRCINFVRSAPAPDHECSTGPRQHITDLTHYVDGSMIYGSSETKTEELRSHRGGRLRTQTIRGQQLLPDDAENPSGCRANTAPDTCSFFAGDIRSSENAALTSQHTEWLRLHNQFADELARLNPQATDEQLFQVSRKIVVGMLQHIVYKEWLPIIVGHSLTNRFVLDPLTSGFFEGYSDELDVSILNVFAASAFRFGHTLIKETFSRLSNELATQGSNDIADVFNSVSLVNQFGTDTFSRGLTQDNAESYDRFPIPGIRDRLFNDELDLFALNIQRGRDHGLGSYNDYRRVLRLGPSTSFDDLRSTHDAATVAALRQIYPNVEDMEIWPAGLTERSLPGALVGPLFANIIALQFFKLKFGDRFYYERNDPITGFTEAQLNDIRQVSLASLTCLVTDVNALQPELFRKAGPGNAMQNCATFHKPDLSLYSSSFPTTQDDGYGDDGDSNESGNDFLSALLQRIQTRGG